MGSALLLKIAIVVFVFALPALLVWIVIKNNKDN